MTAAEYGMVLLAVLLALTGAWAAAGWSDRRLFRLMRTALLVWLLVGGVALAL